MSIDRAVVPGVDLGRDLGLLETVANITAEAVATSREEHAERERLLEENRQLKQELRTARPPELIGNCSAMHKVYAMISQVANSDATVMIRGASGTGKELVAKAIRSGSRRKDKPFVVFWNKIKATTSTFRSEGQIVMIPKTFFYDLIKNYKNE
jgi:Nif-specific regulatory protein